VAVSRIAALPDVDAAAYRPHSLHAPERIWVEKNCYVDIWIELVHALWQEPLAMLPFTLAVDFEGDQWTFFKPPHGELRDLYGIDVQEMTVWRPLLEHAREHLAAGKLISTEADAYWLPDTAGTDYRRQHTKSTIVLNELDEAGRRLGYFHNAGYYTLEGEDFVKTFRLDAAPDPTFMPLFAELVRVDRASRLPLPELKAVAARNLTRHWRFRPATNPVTRFRERFERELPALQERGLAFYHTWAFGTIRQLGAAFELAALHLKWLDATRYRAPAEAFERIAAGGKTLILKAARAVNARRSFDGGGLLDEMAAAWQQGMESLAGLVV